MTTTYPKFKLNHPYSGADWIKRSLAYRADNEESGKARKSKKPPVPTTMSQFGEVVADILGFVWLGIYHMDTELLDKVDWSRDFIIISIRPGEQLSTYDFSHLTSLVLLCHDQCIRLGISAEFGGRLRLCFHQRTREGGMSERHPTIEKAIEAVRADCKHFSRAKGGKPVKKNIRSLAWVVVRWAAEAKPRVIFLENVREFEGWGPLVPRWSCAACDWKGTEGQATLLRARRACPRCESRRLREEKGEDGGPVLVPDPARKGMTFRRFIGRLRKLGYGSIDWKVLNAADYGAPTNRRRLVLVCRRDGKPVVWPPRTHADPAKLGNDLVDRGILTDDRLIVDARIRKFPAKADRIVVSIEGCGLGETQVELPR